MVTPHAVRLTLAAAVLVASCAITTAEQAERRNVILITLDGARVEEMFGGLDKPVLLSTLKDDDVLEQQQVYRRFWAATPEERRQRLMPFFWGTLMAAHGSIAGNPARGSEVRLSNAHRFSYPGYAEMLLGAAHDDRITSNDPLHSPFPTVLEFLRRQFQLDRTAVGVFASWDIFRWIAESHAGTLTIDAGYTPSSDLHPSVREWRELQDQTPTPWHSVRHDAYTFRFALAHLVAHGPRVMYIAFGETDDWAHDGRYDRVLEAYARTDGYLRELWTWLQSQDEYREGTSILLTTDHGRGRTAADWRHHGTEYPDSQHTWMAFVTPGWKVRGEWQDHAPLTTAQVAATLVDWMGADWRAYSPSIAPPVNWGRDRFQFLLRSGPLAAAETEMYPDPDY